MQVIIQWTEHTRRYSIPVEAYLKMAGIEATEQQLKRAARKLLEQKEAEQIDERPTQER